MLNVAPQKERISDHLRAMAEQDDKSAASGKTGEQSSIGVGCAPGEERDSAISICAVHSTTVTAAIAEFCEDTVEKQKSARGLYVSPLPVFLEPAIARLPKALASLRAPLSLLTRAF